MPFQNIGIGGFVLILILVLIIFGPSRLPELGRAVGRTLSEFKSGARELFSGDQEKPEDDTAKTDASQSKAGVGREAGSSRETLPQSPLMEHKG